VTDDERFVTFFNSFSNPTFSRLFYGRAFWQVTIEVVAIPVPFPAISMCNMRNLDFTVMNTLNSLFLADPYPEHHINATDNAFVREYMRTVARYSPLWCDLSCKISSNFASVSLKLLLMRIAWHLGTSISRCR